MKMRITKSISTKERLLIITFSLIAFLFFSSAIGAESVRKYNNTVSEEQRELRRQAGEKDVISFSTDDVHSFPGGFNLINLYIFRLNKLKEIYFLEFSYGFVRSVFCSECVFEVGRDRRLRQQWILY